MGKSSISWFLQLPNELEHARLLHGYVIRIDGDRYRNVQETTMFLRAQESVMGGFAASVSHCPLSKLAVGAHI